MKSTKKPKLKNHEKSKKSTFAKYIKQARKEVATWPEWKIKNTMLCFSEYQRKLKEQKK